jgi:hypothetical protein
MQSRARLVSASAFALLIVAAYACSNANGTFPSALPTYDPDAQAVLPGADSSAPPTEGGPSEAGDGATGDAGDAGDSGSSADAADSSMNDSGDASDTGAPTDAADSG